MLLLVLALFLNALMLSPLLTQNIYADGVTISKEGVIHTTNEDGSILYVWKGVSGWDNSYGGSSGLVSIYNAKEGRAKTVYFRGYKKED
ncbi:hypothetical protein UABAM_03991 [Candidatus Uabimicrobium amorphum]|uniref:Bulb-type lectin domain-containing protein n=2 Tax=Uabimicrobium amorphum TaxID=2596890 RepID=A0A5S9IQ32_UABAM|nr:hypothetical protein UABAM_03991 [Candidatus Uabimicrobium amorphum]